MTKLINVNSLPDCVGDFLCERTCFDCQVYDLCKTTSMRRIIALRKAAGLDTRWEETHLRRRLRDGD